jgi:manganese-dependent inorganic pyrophosphatase
MIIIPNNYSCDISMLEKNKINVIISSLDTIEIINRIVFSNSIKSLVNNYKVEPILEDMSFNEFVKINNRCNYSYYPVINRKGESLGLIKYANIDYNKKKNVILVDHNSYEQSAIGIEEANILEIIDHHNISNIITNSPISFRNMPLGSTCTIVYTMFKENGISIPKNIAGLLLSGILSDTLVLNSPTTTKVDKDAVNHLAKLCKVDYKKYGFDMINYGSNLANKSKEEILYNDFKKYSTKDGKIGLGQIFSTDISNIKKELSDYIDMLNKVKNNNDYVFVCLFITDIIKNGTYVIYSDGAKEILDIAFSDNISECYFFPQILSRKLQVLPSILNVMNS